MNEPTWLNYITAIGAVATPLLVLALTAVGWKLRTQVERRRGLEDKLREDRIQAYYQILEPFVLLLTSTEAWLADPMNKGKDKEEIAKQKVLSLEYRQNASKLSLVGAVAVVKAYNNLMQYSFEINDVAYETSPDDGKQMIALVGHFLLEIRRSMGNEATTLDHWDMLEWFVTDARKYREHWTICISAQSSWPTLAAAD